VCCPLVSIVKLGTRSLRFGVCAGLSLPDILISGLFQVHVISLENGLGGCVAWLRLVKMGG